MTVMKSSLLFVLLLSAQAFAQNSPPRATPDHHERLREEIFEQMRTMRIWKMTSELKLTEPQVAKLFPTLAKFDDKERDLARDRHEIAHALRTAADATTPNANEINALIDKLLVNRARKNAIEDERIKALRQILTPAQQAKMVLLMPRLEDMMKQQVREAIDRDRSRAPGPPAP